MNGSSRSTSGVNNAWPLPEPGFCIEGESSPPANANNPDQNPPRHQHHHADAEHPKMVPSHWRPGGPIKLASDTEKRPLGGRPLRVRHDPGLHAHRCLPDMRSYNQRSPPPNRGRFLSLPTFGSGAKPNRRAGAKSDRRSQPQTADWMTAFSIRLPGRVLNQLPIRPARRAHSSIDKKTICF